MSFDFLSVAAGRQRADVGCGRCHIPHRPFCRRWKGDASPEKALGLTSPRLGRPGSAPKRRAGGAQLYRSLAHLCSASLVVCALCEGYRMASALQKGAAFHAMAHGVSRCAFGLHCNRVGPLSDSTSMDTVTTLYCVQQQSF